MADPPPMTEPASVCGVCGAMANDAEGAPATLGWICERDARRGPRLVCGACARTHLRAIEAKLDQDWW